jgi:hypothetical protein
MKLKKSAYILLMTMIILSSLSLLLLKMIKESSAYFNLNRAFDYQYNEKKNIIDAIVVVKDLLLVEKKRDDNKKNGTDQKKNPNGRFADFFEFYWLYGNRWLDYSLVHDGGITTNIKVYITFNDGKIPINYPLKKFFDIKKNLDFEHQGAAENSSGNNDASNDQNQSSGGNDPEKILKNNPSIEEFLKVLGSLEKDENSFLKKLITHIAEATGAQDNKKIGIVSLVQNYIKKILYPPNRLIDLFSLLNDSSEIADLYQKLYCYDSAGEKNKRLSVSDVFAVDTSTLNMLFVSPGVMSILGNKQIEINDEVRRNIVKDGIQFIGEKNTVECQKFWETVLEKHVGIKYPHEFFSNSEVKKITSGKVSYPDYIEVILQVNNAERNIFALVCFEKNRKYDKTNEKEHNQNREYLIRSIQIFPNE